MIHCRFASLASPQPGRPSRKRHRPTPKSCVVKPPVHNTLRVTIVCLLFILPALLFASSDATPGSCSSTCRDTHDRWLATQVRGGGRKDKEPDDNERFWSLGALFRLNADTQDEAASRMPDGSDEDEELDVIQPGNGRGGALAIRTAQPPKSGVLDTRVSPASSRFIQNDTEGEVSDDDGIETLEDSVSADEDSYDVYDTEVLQPEEVPWTLESSETPATDLEVPEVEEPWWVKDDMNEEAESVTPFLGRKTTENSGEVTGTTAADWWEEGPNSAYSKDASSGYTNDNGSIEVDSTHDVSPILSSKDDVPSDKDNSSDVKPTLLSTLKQQLIIPDGLNKVTSLWWGNVWMEPLSSFPAESEIVEETHDPVAASITSKLYPTARGASTEEEVQTLEMFESFVSSPEFVADSTAQGYPIDALIQETLPPSLAGRPDPVMYVPPESSESLSPRPVPPRSAQSSAFISSGHWSTIDKVVSMGYSPTNPALRVSRHLRPVRKVLARATGLHGVLSGKGRRPVALLAQAEMPGVDSDTLNDDDLDLIRRRIAVIEKAKESVNRRAAADAEVVVMNRRGIFRRNRQRKDLAREAVSGASIRVSGSKQQSPEEFLEDQRRKERVKQIDKLISKGQAELLELQCEKDALQQRPNPFYNYTTTTVETMVAGRDTTDTSIQHSRRFNFPPEELVEEYLDEIFAHGRVVKLNHTHLWNNGAAYDDEEETVGDDLLTPSADARKLYEYKEQRPRPAGGNGNGMGGGGSWILRQSLGRGGSFGEKIGEGVEAAAYKAICAAVMEALAKSIAAIHGINVLTHSDIRLVVEDYPDLPPVGRSVLPGSDHYNNYAQEAILEAMTRAAKKRRRRGSRSRYIQSEESFIQRDAVVETLISHCQISAPLLKLFPLSWQRALLGNIITLIAAVVSDFCDGIQLQILGHQLSFCFKPITEVDMIRHIGMAGHGFNSRRAKPEEFEAAVRATADDVSEKLKFLDRWHERALGSGMLRAQIANLIARIVLTLTDEVLSGARMDMWAAQAGGPRIVAGLEYRTMVSDNDSLG